MHPKCLQLKQGEFTLIKTCINCHTTCLTSTFSNTPLNSYSLKMIKHLHACSCIEHMRHRQSFLLHTSRKHLIKWSS